MKRADPTKDDADCCKELTKKRGRNKGAYANLEFATLQRRLRDARKHEHARGYEGFCAMMRRAQSQRVNISK